MHNCICPQLIETKIINAESRILMALIASKCQQGCLATQRTIKNDLCHRPAGSNSSDEKQLTYITLFSTQLQWTHAILFRKPRS